MKQLIQNLRTGDTSLEEIPAPGPSKGSILVQTTRSLVSLGTERMLVEFGKASLIQKARQQPDRVQQVLDKIKSEGLLPTLEAVFNKLDQPIPLGYCNVGRVVAVGNDDGEFQVGDRVVSNGPHAEFVSVPTNLAAKIPHDVTDDDAAFAIVGSIGLQGIRLSHPTFGETIVVTGLGLIGLLTAQLAKANGCKVIGFDTDPHKVDLAASLGISAFNVSVSDPVFTVKEATRNVGADVVIITASAKGDELIHQAALMSRKKGRIVLVGVIGLDLKRADFYEKELTLQVSCSYGPGRYDELYEQKGQDYPLAYVRWTAKRNFESVLQSIASGQLHVKPLITDKIPFEDFHKVYGDLNNVTRIASVLSYSSETLPTRKVVLTTKPFAGAQFVTGIVGAGNFVKATLLPALKKNGITVRAIASANGLSGTLMAKKYGIEISTTDHKELLNDGKISLVIITTRHSHHARMVVDAMKAGKHIFVEKPLALNKEELSSIVETYRNLETPVLIHVGFNRRFSSHSMKIKSLLGDSPGAMNLIITMNAGFIPQNHWVQDLKEGGRIIGEACHLVDLAVYFTGSRVKSVSGQSLGNFQQGSSDNCSFLLKMDNGSNVTVNYFANGSKAYSKEKIELFYQEKTLVIDNFRITTGFGWPSFNKLKSSLDKGHVNQIFQLKTALESKRSLISFDQLVNVTATTFAMIDSLRDGLPKEVENF